MLVLIAVMRVENKRMRMRWRRKTTTGFEADFFFFLFLQDRGKETNKEKRWRLEERGGEMATH